MRLRSSWSRVTTRGLISVCIAWSRFLDSSVKEACWKRKFVRLRSQLGFNPSLEVLNPVGYDLDYGFRHIKW